MLGRFRLDRSVANVPSSDDLEPQEASFRVSSPPLDDSEPVFRYGDFKSDSQNAKYNMTWPSWPAFELFLHDTQTQNAVEFLKVQTTSGGEWYMSRILFYCSRHGTGGTKSYTRLHPNWKDRKIGSKLTKCSASLKVKTYHGTETVLGIYDDEHNHPTGKDNLRYTRISLETRQWIAGMVRLGVKATEIVSLNNLLVLPLV